MINFLEAIQVKPENKLKNLLIGATNYQGLQNVYCMVSIECILSAQPNREPFSCLPHHIFCINSIEVTLELALIKLKILIIQWKVVILTLFQYESWSL